LQRNPSPYRPRLARPPAAGHPVSSEGDIALRANERAPNPLPEARRRVAPLRRMSVRIKEQVERLMLAANSADN